MSDDFGLRMLDVPRASRIPAPARPLTPRPPLEPLIAPEVFELRGMMRLGSVRRLGVTVEGLDDQLAEYFGVKEGVLVKSVQADSAAQKAGIKAGDVITGLNGSKVYDPVDLNRVIERIAETGEFTAEIVREKKTQSVKGKVEARDTRTRARVRAIL